MSVEQNKKLTKRLSKLVSINSEYIQQFMKFSTFSSNSEQIVNFIIEKLISYTVTKSEKNKVESQLPEVCFNFITDTIDTYIEQQFIAVDKIDNIGSINLKEPDNNDIEDNQNNNNNSLPENIDNLSSIDNNKKIENNNDNNNIINEPNNLNNNFDFSQISNIESQQNVKNDNNKNSSENIYFNNYIHGENFWSVIDEPENSEKDRFISTTLFPYLPEETDLNMKNNKNATKKSLEKVEEEDDNNLLESNKSKSNIKIKLVPEQKNVQTNNNIEKNEENNKSNSKINLDENKEEFNKTKNKTKTSSIFQKKKKKNLFEIMSEFPFYDLPKEEQMSEINKEGIDYATLREEKELEIKKIEDEEKKKQRLKREENQKLKEEADKKKAYQNKKLTVDVNGKIVFIKGVNLDSLSKEFNTIKSNLKQLTKNKGLEPPPRKFSIYYNPVDKEKEKEKNQNSSNNKTNKTKKLISPEELLKSKVINNNNNNNPFKLPPIKTEIEKKLERGPITPAGSNFDLIQMEIGVSLKEDEKYKTGGKDFFQKFNKYSLDTYNNKLKDSIIYNSIDVIKNKLGLTNSVDFHNNLTETYTSNFGNQLGNTNTSLFKKNNLKTTNNFNIPTNHLNSTLNPEISIKGNLSLSNAFNQLDLLPDYKLKEINQNRKNIFKSKDNKKNKSSEKNLNEINQFTATLLGLSRWGNNSMNQRKLNPIKKPKKPLNNEIQKEMGMTGRNLRERNKGQNYMSRSVAMNFFQP